MTTPQHPPWLARALKEVGYHEGPNNENKFGKALGLNNVPWCDLFVTRMCQLSGHPLPPMQPGMSTGAASVWYSMQFAKAHGLFVPSHKAKPGFQIVYGWQGPSSPPAEMHTGLVVSSGPVGSTGHTVEGNRGDQVGRFTFTVGESVVLGCIDLPKLLGREQVHVRPPKPDPQPRNPHHPAHTGPSPKHIPPPQPKEHHMTTPTPKAGLKTTEFWSHLIAQALAVFTLLGQFNTTSPLGNALIKLAAILGSAGAASGYAISRGKAKQVKAT